MLKVQKFTQTHDTMLMPCPFTGLKIFWAGPNFLCQTKNLFTFCARQKDDLHSGRKSFEKTLNAAKFLGWFKAFEPAQNILEPVKGQGTSF